MRCIGADNPPCIRCAKVKRNCVVRDSQGSTNASSQLIQADESVTSSLHPLSPLTRFTNSSEARTNTLELPINGQRLEAGNADEIQSSLPRWTIGDMTQPSRHVKIINLPSVYMNSPLGTIDAQLNASSAPDHLSQREALVQSSSALPNSSPLRSDIPQSDLLNLLQL